MKNMRDNKGVDAYLRIVKLIKKLNEADKYPSNIEHPQYQQFVDDWKIRQETRIMILDKIMRIKE